MKDKKPEKHFRMSKAEKGIWATLIISSICYLAYILIDHYRPFIQPIIHGLLNK